MMEFFSRFLEFTFQSFWHWLGIFLLFVVGANAIVSILHGILTPPIIILKNTKLPEEETEEDESN